MWQIWYKVVAMNLLRGVILHNIDKFCLCYNFGQEGSILHQFWACQIANQTWQFVTKIIWHLGAVHTTIDDLTWAQSIFLARLLRSLQGVAKFWSLLTSVILWTF
jgi:hypothetical protein